MTMEALEAAKGKLANRWLLVVLVFLVIIIVGLIGAIIYFGDGIGVSESGDMGVMIERDQLAANDANDEVGEILGKLRDESDYTVQDAEEDFEVAMLNSEGNKKFYLGVAYAFFLYDYYEDLNRSLAVLDGLSDVVGDDLEVGYYMMYRNLYFRAGKDDEAREYNRKIIEMSGDSDESD